MKNDAVLRQRVAELHTKYGPLVHRRALTLLRREDIAQDLTQEVFLRVMQNIQTFRAEASPVTWLYRITTNLCIDHLRRQARREVVSLTPEMQRALSSPEPATEGRMLHRQHLDRLLRRLDPQTIQILVYTHLDEMSQEEIAQTMGLSRKTVWSKLQRARKRLAARSAR